MLVKCNLDSILKEIGITGNAFSEISGVRLQTVYSLINDKPGVNKAIKFETLHGIITNLNRLAFERGIDRVYTAGDLLTVIDDFDYHNAQLQMTI